MARAKAAFGQKGEVQGNKAPEKIFQGVAAVAKVMPKEFRGY